MLYLNIQSHDNHFVPQTKHKSLLKCRLTDPFQIQLIPVKCIKKQLKCHQCLLACIFWVGQRNKHTVSKTMKIPELCANHKPNVVFEVHTLAYPEILSFRLAVWHGITLSRNENLIFLCFVCVTWPHLTISLLKTKRSSSSPFKAIWFTRTSYLFETTHFTPHTRIQCVAPHSIEWERESGWKRRKFTLRTHSTNQPTHTDR